MSSVYHILYYPPAMEKEETPPEYEHAAHSLLNSGKIRIDAGDESNFVRFSDNSIDFSATFTDIEINDPKISENTKARLRDIYKKRYGGESLGEKISQIFAKLRNELKKISKIPEEKKIKLARLLVQAAHPIVIKWLEFDGAEIFISYGHSIGDVMDVPNWLRSGQNSGMQSTDGKDAAVFVSCGGDPFGVTDEKHYSFGDGRPAVARTLIIAAQEMGHFADIVRDEKGRQVGRHSALYWGRKTYGPVREARLRDIERTKNLGRELQKIGINKLSEYEKYAKLYKDHGKKGLGYCFYRFLIFIFTKILVYRARANGLLFVALFEKDEFPGTLLKAAIEDTLFNLSPKADVYRREDKDEEEAIACVEALARVPQQVLKWGHLAISYMMGDLYKVYYGRVIPSLISRYEEVTGVKYRRNLKPPRQSLTYKIKKFLGFVKVSGERDYRKL